MTTPSLRRARRALEAGLAHNAAGRPAVASARFRASLQHLGEPDGTRESAYVRARALLGLVMGDFELRADVDTAMRVLDEAEIWAREAHAPAVAVAVIGQRGVLCLRRSDPVAGLRELDRAVAMADLAEPLDAAILLLNRGNLNLQLGRLGPARSDLAECSVRATALGDDLLRFKAVHNLGYVEFLAGDLPQALEAMARAAMIDQRFPAISLLDRSRVLLEAGLVAEADEHLARAGEVLARQRLAQDRAEVELDRARCALLTARPDDALVLARSARARFARRGNETWLLRAELVVLRARLASLIAAQAPSRSLRGLAEDARGLALASRTRGAGEGRDLAREAWLTAAEAELEAGRIARARAALVAAGRFGVAPSLAVQVVGHQVRARLAFDEGRPAAGRRHVAAGQRVLAEHRRQFGSVASVTAAAVHGERLWQVDVGAALASGSPARVLDAVERGRATTAGPARVRPPADPLLAERLSELRRVVEEARDLPESAASRRRELAATAAALRTEVRDRSWQLGEGTGPPPPLRAGELRAALRGLSGGAVVDLFTHGGRLHAVVAGPDGLRLVEGPRVGEVESIGRRLKADLDALAHPLPDALRAVVLRSLGSGLVALDALVVEPLAVTGPLHLVAGGTLEALPWGLLPSRRGLPTTVSPRLDRAPEPAERVGVVALAGPGLRHAGVEAEAVAGAWPGATAVTGATANCAATLAAFGSARVIHVAAHGRHEADNPLFSWVRMADGPLFAHELEGVSLAGATVVLAACEVGRATVRAGGEGLGLASVLLRLGATAVVASLAPMRDELSAQVMPALHRELAAGSLPGTAVAAVLGRRPADDPVPLTCFVGGLRGVGRV